MTNNYIKIGRLVVYVALDAAGAWKVEVIKELKACGYQTKQWP